MVAGLHSRRVALVMVPTSQLVEPWVVFAGQQSRDNREDPVGAHDGLLAFDRFRFGAKPYQARERFSGGSHIGSPSSMPKVSYHASTC